MIMQWLEARAWQIGAIAAGAAALGMAVSLSIANARLHDAQATRDALQASIDAPVTGWAARLTTAQNNAATLEATIKSRNDQIDAMGKDSKRRLDEAAAALAAADKRAASDQARIDKLMKPLVGVGTCQRVIEADQRLLESLK
jgi:chromosome segregation ATPase